MPTIGPRLIMLSLCIASVCGCSSTNQAPSADWGALGASHQVTGQEAGQTTAPTPSEVLSSIYLLKAFDSQGKEFSQGSGFVSSSKIITNAHVIADAAWVQAYDSEGRHVTTAPYANYIDIENDIAVLPFPGANLPGLKLRTEKPELGDKVWAYGSPLGLQNTVTTGNVSGFRNTRSNQLLQISAPISQGSSGGPITDESGAVIGVVVSTVAEGQNLNFAVPSSVLPDLNLYKSTSVAFPSSSSLAQHNDEESEISTQRLFFLASVLKSTQSTYGVPFKGDFAPEDGDSKYQFRFHAYQGKKGDTVEFASSSADGIDTDLLVIDASWAEEDDNAWAVADDYSGLGTNPYLSTTLQRDGEYYVVVGAPREAKGRYTLYSRYIPQEVALGSRWAIISADDDGEEYIDQSTLRETPSYSSYSRRAVTAWIYLYSYEAKLHEDRSYKHSMFHIKFLCSDYTFQLLEVKRLLGETWKTTSSNWGETMSIAPETKGERWFQRACQK